MKRTLYVASLLTITTTLAGVASGEDVVYQNGTGTTASASNGGAVYNAADKTFSLTGKDDVTFLSNSSTYAGGAIWNGKNSTVEISNNQDVTFQENSTKIYGGAIRADGADSGKSSYINLTNNTSVTFQENKIDRSGEGVTIYGGAINANSRSTVNLNENGSVKLQGNFLSTQTQAYGGALCLWSDTTLNLNKNTGDVTIQGNSVTTDRLQSWGTTKAQGGAIYSQSAVNIIGNKGTVSIEDNSVKLTNAYQSDIAQGGAICTVGGSLNISDNKEVVFRGNSETTYNKAILRSIYMTGKGALNLSAAEGGSISIFDSIYTDTDITVDFNATEGNTGKIIFSGKNIIDDLLAINSDATDDEINESRTSVINNTITLHAGTLSLQDGAVLQATQLIVKEGATLEFLSTEEVTVAMLATMAADSGSSALDTTLDADLYMSDNSVLNLTHSTLNMNGNDVILGDDVTFILSEDLIQSGNIKAFENVTLKDKEGQALERTIVKVTDGNTTYNATIDTNGDIVISNDNVPEPATTTLSLLALAALATRRRRH